MSGHSIRERERSKSLSLFCDRDRRCARNLSLIARFRWVRANRASARSECVPVCVGRPAAAVSECVLYCAAAAFWGRLGMCPCSLMLGMRPSFRPASLSRCGAPCGRLGKCPCSPRGRVPGLSRNVSLFPPRSRASRNVSPLQRHFPAAHDRLAFRFSRVPATRRAAEKRKGHRANGGPFLTRSRREAGTRYRSKRNPTPAAIATQPGKRMSKHSRTPAAGRRRGRCSR